jgi:hypothetical protein
MLSPLIDSIAAPAVPRRVSRVRVRSDETEGPGAAPCLLGEALQAGKPASRRRDGRRPNLNPNVTGSRCRPEERLRVSTLPSQEDD